MVSHRLAGWLGATAVRLLLATLLLVLVLGACGGSKARKKVKLPPPVNPKIGWTEVGVASWYGHPYHGRKAANGETYDMNKMTAAHKRLPFDTWLNVKNLSNGKTTKVRINDRGPFVGNRIIDLSRAAASDINMIGSGTARVRLTVIRPPSGSGGKSRNRTSPASAKQEGKFDIQLGVFSSQANAQALAQKATKRGHPSTVQKFSQSGATRYRVVARGGSFKEANARLAKLKRQGFAGIIRARRG